MLRGGAVVARQAHNLKAVGSIPTPATNLLLEPAWKIIQVGFFLLKISNLANIPPSRKIPEKCQKTASPPPQMAKSGKNPFELKPSSKKSPLDHFNREMNGLFWPLLRFGP